MLDFMFKAAQEGYFDPGQMTLDDNGYIRLLLQQVEYFALSGVRQLPVLPMANNGLTWVSPGPILSNQNTKPVAGRYLKARNWLDADFNFQDGRKSGAYCQMA